VGLRGFHAVEQDSRGEAAGPGVRHGPGQ
jgi:hypothetical protein